jgi:membrane-associated protease RseP (regulator of RpoE activity)
MATDAKNTTWLKPFEEVRRAVAGDEHWSLALGAPGSTLPACGIHLAVFVAPFLGYVLDGSKTVESRFSVNRTPPYGKVCQGDVILLKQSGGPVVGLARVQTVWSYHLDEESLRFIRERFASALCAQDPGFWKGKVSAAFATLMAIHQVLAVEDIAWEKRDRRGWVVVQGAADATPFRGNDER